jgi:hypothetical protein
VRAGPLVRRLLSPTGFVLAALCFLLPFLAVRCESPQATGVSAGSLEYRWAGVDLVTGRRPDLEVRQEQDGNLDNGLERYAERNYAGGGAFTPPALVVAAQPLAIIALALLAIGLASAALPRGRWRAVAGAGSAMLAALALIGAQAHARAQLTARLAELAPAYVGSDDFPDSRRFVHTMGGFWLAFVLLMVVGLVNVVAAVPARRAVDARAGVPDDARAQDPQAGA